MEEGERAQFGPDWGRLELEKSPNGWRFSFRGAYPPLPTVILLDRRDLLDLTRALAAELGFTLTDPPV